MLLAWVSSAEAQIGELQKLLASDRQSYDQCGCSVAMSGDWLVVGARLEGTTPNYENSGAAYVFERDSDGNWIEVQKLLASDRQSYDQFGCSVAISDDRLVVGALQEDTSPNGNNGAAYVFERDSNGNWIEVQKLLASDRQNSDYFGCSVAMSGDRLAVGAYVEDTSPNGNNGAAYVFERDSNGNWIEVQKLLASDRQSSDQFGCSVAILGDWLVVGAVNEDTAPYSENGAAYVFERDPGGNWIEGQKLLASDRQSSDQFGCSVAISDDRLVVGAVGEGSTPYNNGAAYVFERDAGGNWIEVQKLLASDRQSDDQFGYSVAISGDWLVVGAQFEDTSPNYDNGAAYVFERDAGGSWIEMQKFLASDRQSYDQFACSVAMSGDWLVVGAQLEDAPPFGNNGAAYVFRGPSIVLWADDSNPQSCAVIFRAATDTLYLTGRMPSGFQGVSRAEFRLQVSAPIGFYFGYVPPAGAQFVGDPMDLTPENPSDQAGTSLVFDPCITGPPGTLFDLGWVVVHNVSGGTSSVEMRPKIPPSIPSLDYVLFYECDDPIYTPRRVLYSRPLPLNSDDCVAEPPIPLGVTAAVTETSIVVNWEGTDAPQVIGYNVYRRIDGAANELLNAAPWLDSTYVDTDDVGFESQCYEVTTLDLIGRESSPSAQYCLAPFSWPRSLLVSLQVRPQQATLTWEQPVLGQPSGYFVYRDGQHIGQTVAPDTTFVDDSLLAGDVCYSVVGVNSASVEGTHSAETCVFVWLMRSLPLDSHDVVQDGSAGPVATPQRLFAGQQYMITVQGTYSLWPSTTWTQPGRVVCGMPEIEPMTPSPGVQNYWVGFDAEWLFAAVLPPGGDCVTLDSLGYGPHPNRFQIDLGDGFQHLEPMGGRGEGPHPEHTYRYLVTGQDSVAQFALFDSTTSDNYGVLTITIEEVTPILTDTPPFARPTRLVVLPNVPNPFNPGTEIRYQLPAAGHVSVTIHDVRGRLVRRVFFGAQNEGERSVRWDGRSDLGLLAPSGAYIVRVVGPTGSAARKLVLLR